MAEGDRNGRADSPLRARRLELDLIQPEVAELVGCSVPYISMCESGYVPTLPKQEAIAAALQASVGSFWP